MRHAIYFHLGVCKGMGLQQHASPQIARSGAGRLEGKFADSNKSVFL